MGGLFSKPSAPKIPTPPPPPEPAKAPSRSASVTVRDEARRRAILAARSQIATSPRGLLAPASTSGQSLLGG